MDNPVLFYASIGLAIVAAALIVSLARAARLQAEIRRRTRALDESEAGLRRAQSLAKLAHVVSAADGTFERWSDTFPQLLQLDDRGMPPDTRAWLQFVHPEDRDLFRSKAIQAGTAGQRTAVEYRLVRADGSCAHILQVMEPIQAADASFDGRWFSTLQDVTGQKRVEEEVRRLNADLEKRVASRTAELEESNLRLKKADAAKSNFLSMMSHEIRTPMNGVLGMLELLSLSKLDGHQRTTLEVVRSSARSLLRIIDDILDFSKIEAGKLEINLETASVAKVIEAVAGIYAGNASSKALVLKAYCDPRISPAVKVDPLRLQQILNNLVSNAIKFTPEGWVEIRADLLARDGRNDVVRFSVKDTGIGISPEVNARIFQPFAQAGGEIARSFGGTGLGLSICQRLAQLMGSSIAVESEPGRGTTMNFSLALQIADPATLAGSPGSHAPGATKEVLRMRRKAPSAEEAQREGTLVLVVDDHPVNRMVLLRQVNAAGYAAEEVGDGREAFAAWKTGRFALVLTDCNMPEMDGYALARAIREAERRSVSRRTTIVACTANALRGEAQNCFAAGMDDYIVKPVELTTLLALLDKWLASAGVETSNAAERSLIQ